MINFVQIIGSVVRVHVNNHKVHDTARKCECTCNFHVSLHCACSFQIYWADSGELCCIATDESFFILKYVAENVAKAQENPESITEDGIEDAFDVRLTLSCWLWDVEEALKMLVYCCFAAGLHCLCRTDISTYNCYMYLKYQLMQEPSILFCIVLLFFSWNHMKRTCFNMHSVHVIVVYLKISWCRNRPFTIFVLGLWRNRGYCEDWYLGWRLFHLHQCCESFELLCWRWNCHHCPLRQVCSYLCIMFQG